tara:strand:+ start:2251 stop:2544 length:294 start_codon:yes stop_codon:yes gene_type:complete
MQQLFLTTKNKKIQKRIENNENKIKNAQKHSFDTYFLALYVRRDLFSNFIHFQFDASQCTYEAIRRKNNSVNISLFWFCFRIFCCKLLDFVIFLAFV